MNPERWARVKELFEQAVELSGEDRRLFLEQACDGDEALHHEVDSLLRADESNDSVLDVPLAEALGDLVKDSKDRGDGPHGDRLEGMRFGPYRVVEEIGRGGMAVVFGASRDDDQFEKQVAIKLIKRGMDTDAIVARFRRERQILANLEHPNIARLLDGGVTEDGLPYLVMERVDGQPIDLYCDARRLTINQRLRLFRTVCSAVHTAHQNLVVHRDLKPSNVLVSQEGVPKLLDFGIAKLLDGPRDESAMATLGQPTAVGPRPMTPEYASPEQLRGEPVTTASDVYSLGVLLYELLTGHRPLDLGTLSPRQVEEAVCEQLPPRPSACLTRPGPLGPRVDVPANRDPAEWLGELRSTAPQKLQRRLRGDLDNIVLKALDKSPNRRYRSVEQLSEDLRRHLVGLPVEAQAHTLLYRTGKFARRNRWGVLAAALIFLSLVAGLASTAWQAQVAREQRGRAEWVSQFMVDLFAISHPSEARGETVTARQILDRGAERVRRGLDEAPPVRAEILRSIGLAYAKLGLYEAAEPLLLEAVDLRQGEASGDPLALASALNDLGELYTELARNEDAERLHREALAARERGTPGSDDHIESLNSLALAVYHQDRLGEAEDLLRHAIELQEQNGRAAHSDFMLETTRNNLALVLKGMGRLQEAEALYAQALESNRRRFGDDHPEVAVNLNNLAEVLRVEGACERAVPLYEEALALEEKLLGSDHANVAGLRNNLAGCFKDLGRLDEAERLYGIALESRRRALGEQHPDVAETMNNLAEIHFRRRDLPRSASLYRQALNIQQQHHQSEHADVARTLGNLATVLADQGQHEEAESLYRQALDMQLRLDGESHGAVATQRHNLARLLLKRRRVEEAEAAFSAAFENRRDRLGEDHRDTTQSHFGMAVAAGLAGPPERAEDILRHALEVWQRRGEDGRGQVASLQSLLGGVLLDLGRIDEAESQLLASEEAKPDPRTRRRLVELYEGLGHAERADAYREVVP